MYCHQQWAIPPRDLQMQPGEVHVWQVPLIVPDSSLQQLQGVLSEGEVARAMSFHFEKDRKRWMVARGVLRMLLSRYLQLDPGLLQFEANRFGKPSLVFPALGYPLQFNLSHSCDLALYAFTFTRQVGIDVEYKRADLDYEALARICFSLYEQGVLQTLLVLVKQEAFYNCWTRKEAYIKARGQGMSIPLDQFDVSFEPGEPAALLQSREDPHEIKSWTIRELFPAVGYVGALACEGKAWSLLCWQWQHG